MTLHRPRLAPFFAVAAAVLLTACGGSDAAETDAGSSSDGESGSDPGSASERIATGRGAPCDVIPVSVIEEALGGSYTTAIDEFVDTICQYTGSPNFAIAWGPRFGNTIQGNFERNAEDPTLVQLSDIADFAYLVGELELAFRLDSDAVSLQGEMEMSTQGIVVAKAIVAELGG